MEIARLGRKKLKFVNERICRRCGYAYKVRNSRQKYCGSWRKKIGCSLIVHIETNRKTTREWWRRNYKKPEFRLKEQKRTRERGRGKSKRINNFNFCRCYLCPIHYKLTHKE